MGTFGLLGVAIFLPKFPQVSLPSKLTVSCMGDRQHRNKTPRRRGTVMTPESPGGSKDLRKSLAAQARTRGMLLWAGFER
jgi:hypothetical protein